MNKDRIVELTLVVRLDRHLDDDLELVIRDYLVSEGLLEVIELVRVGAVDLPRVWASSGGPIYDANLDPNAKKLPPPPPPPDPPPELTPLPKLRWWNRR